MISELLLKSKPRLTLRPSRSTTWNTVHALDGRGTNR